MPSYLSQRFLEMSSPAHLKGCFHGDSNPTGKINLHSPPERGRAPIEVGGTPHWCFACLSMSSTSLDTGRLGHWAYCPLYPKGLVPHPSPQSYFKKFRSFCLPSILSLSWGSEVCVQGLCPPLSHFRRSAHSWFAVGLRVCC